MYLIVLAEGVNVILYVNALLVTPDELGDVNVRVILYVLAVVPTVELKLVITPAATDAK